MSKVKKFTSVALALAIVLRETCVLRFTKLAGMLIAIALSIALTACIAANGAEPTAIEEEISPLAEQISMFTEESPSLDGDVFEDDDDYHEYYEFISDIPNFAPYYKFVFEPSALPDGISSVNPENVIAMYNELKTEFDFINVAANKVLTYIGNYEGDTRFVDRYEFYLSHGAETGFPNPINNVGHDMDGNEIVTTPLKTIVFCKDSIGRFDGYIADGRNLQETDFTLAAPDDPIPVVLGSAYEGIYEIGDVFSMVYMYVPMNFKVVGFYKPGVEFSMETGAMQQMNIDETIVMPYFIPAYEPDSNAEVLQHGIHIAELLSGYLAITEPVAEINNDTHARYADMVEEIAKRHDLSGVTLSALLPVGFVFD